MGKKSYSDSWSEPEVEVELTKRVGNGAGKEVREAVLRSAREQFQKKRTKYGMVARNDARQNLRTSLALFGPRGKFWIQGEEAVEQQDDDYETTGISYCAIGAIHKADGQAEHLARLAADLAAGELFPKRATELIELDYYNVGETIKLELPDVVTFNDHDDTTFPDVKKVFTRAVELLS